jgi:ABC-type anion transport system duplicated permease subunit
LSPAKSISTRTRELSFFHPALATDSENLPVLRAATILMSLIVVTMNRTLWQRLYRLAATRYKLET